MFFSGRNKFAKAATESKHEANDDEHGADRLRAFSSSTRISLTHRRNGGGADDDLVVGDQSLLHIVVDSLPSNVPLSARDGLSQRF